LLRWGLRVRGSGSSSRGSLPACAAIRAAARVASRPLRFRSRCSAILSPSTEMKRWPCSIHPVPVLRLELWPWRNRRGSSLGPMCVYSPQPHSQRLVEMVITHYGSG
jgi:hypothetical protein